jgi:osmotically-inducible protein OsmY
MVAAGADHAAKKAGSRAEINKIGDASGRVGKPSLGENADSRPTGHHAYFVIVQSRRNAMKTDAQLQREVLDELAWDPRIDHAGIGVAVHNGVVTFSGFVGDYSQKEVVESIARRIVGVKGIAEEITVRFPSDPKTSDSEIAERVIELFKWDVGIPSDKITVKVERHWVTLSGTVDWHFQRDLARRAAGRITGVLGVTNLIAVRQQPSPTNVKDLITASFKRMIDTDTNSIRVTTDGGTVKLEGKVHSWHERQLAENAAWSAPGVARVEDKIAVV